MTQTNERWGTDLRLLRNLEHQNDRDRAHDLSTTVRSQTKQVDLEVLSEANNLIQALLLRFLTPLGELTPLGHPDYGCRLFELMGELNNETNRNRAKLFVLQALAAEPRVKQVLSVTVTQNKSDRSRMDINVFLKPIDSDTPLNLVFPFFLEGGVG
ncbi:MAG TPA: hypothetical protein DCE56_45125 [Cyanobacteria bacterium UBA8553]|nr:hypothetical protein [Cyanobacteria bacterium UBA8553]HAJ64464.1 hypothetical protein [Cyanobacteria bacterium UBA8543]